MRALVLALLVALPAIAAAEDAAPAAGGTEKIKVAVINLKPNGVPEDLANTLTSVLSTEIGRLGVFGVITNEEIRALLSHDALRQALGCEAGASCTSDLGSALGARYLVSGDVGKVGATYALNLALTDTQKSVVLSRQTVNVDDSAKLLDAATRSSRTLVAKVLSEHQGTLIVTCSERGATVKIDGSVVGTTPLPRQSVTWGPHELEVEKKGFISGIEDFSMQTNGVVERSITLIPSPDFLNDYESGARGMRIGAWITTGVAVAAIAGATYFQINQMRLSSQFNNDKLKYEAENPPLQSDYDALSKVRSQALQSLNFTYILVGGAVAAAGIATYLWIAGNDPEKYSRYRGLGQNGNAPVPDAPKFALRLDGGGGMLGATLTFR